MALPRAFGSVPAGGVAAIHVTGIESALRAFDVGLTREVS